MLLCFYLPAQFASDTVSAVILMWPMVWVRPGGGWGKPATRSWNTAGLRPSSSLWSCSAAEPWYAPPTPASNTFNSKWGRFQRHFCWILLLCLLTHFTSFSSGSAAGIWRYLHREEKSHKSGFRGCRQDIFLHLCAGNVPQVDRLWLQEVFHQLLVLAGLSHSGCKLTESCVFLKKRLKNETSPGGKCW